jgi:uncharacterized membrane protein YhaH (DUF805 family)
MAFRPLQRFNAGDQEPSTFAEQGISMNDYLAVMRKYAVFSGRSSRREYWMFALMVLLIMLACVILDPLLGIYILPGVFKTSTSAELNGSVVAASQHDGIGILMAIAYVVHLIPGLAVAIRRFHDSNKSAWNMLLALIPLVNVYLLYLLCRRGTQGPNNYGPSPLRPVELRPAALRA